MKSVQNLKSFWRSSQNHFVFALFSNFEFSHNLKWYIIRISFERVLRNIQNNLLLIVYQRYNWSVISLHSVCVFV
jgi:hypothetical protein